ncbi:peptidoglycan endopeptidase [Sphingomonas sp. KR1UV-12]|uniref:Peptidoglycan endopeptidase n=1 Tax=Sphingomonas aurea TaxID=3063994 RepID=A0ABT9ELD6_9SPHN|nr:peptidoglycan endopeptidase [Sphingomonas sp. KR1UV-12]MDP1027782.1 peptidoglycan endopeptidase [Sphingomonas sp. KR1UV-12]
MAGIALALVGARFRLHGRDPVTGLDCVGLAALALGIEGVPTGYPLRGGEPERWMAVVDAWLVRAGDRRAGDLLMMRTGPGQLHLGVWTGDALVHADAGLGRVAVRPGVPPWPVLASWRRG